MQKLKTNDTEVILIDEDDGPGKNDKYKLPGIAQRILKKQKLSNGTVKYLVKWQGKGEDDATWELEEPMKAKYSELIQDYEFYVLTGERFEDGMLNKGKKQLPEEKSKSGSPKQELRVKKTNKAVKCQGRSMESYTREAAERTGEFNCKREKKLQKRKEKDSSLMENSEQNQDSSKSLGNRQLKQLEILGFNLRKQNTYGSQLNYMISSSKLLPNSQDKIRNVNLVRLSSNGQVLFKIIRSPRVDGVIPLEEFYSFTTLENFCPQLIVGFYEMVIQGNFHYEDTKQQIIYSCDGDTNSEKLMLVQRILEEKDIKIQDRKIQDLYTNQDETKIQVLQTAQQNLTEQMNHENQQELPNIQQEILQIKPSEEYLSEQLINFNVDLNADSLSQENQNQEILASVGETVVDKPAVQEVNEQQVINEEKINQIESQIPLKQQISLEESKSSEEQKSQENQQISQQ